MAGSPGTAVLVAGLRKNYGPVTALAGVDLAVAEGEMFALLGPNGAGKTTLFSILSTLRSPSAGTASVFGHDVVKARTAVRRLIGIVFQDPAVDQRLSTRDNLELMARFYGVASGEARKRAESLLQSLHLEEAADRPARTLSGGQRRRLELARSLVADPKVLFLDEATLGLDVDARRGFWAEVRALARRGLTVFFTTHYMEEADVADRIALIDKGRIVTLDTPRALKNELGGGVIRLATEDDEQAQAWLASNNYTPERNEDGLMLVSKDAASLLPVLLRDMPVKVLQVEVHEPSLEDVFLRRTGRSLGDGAAAGPHLFRRIGLA